MTTDGRQNLSHNASASENSNKLSPTTRNPMEFNLQNATEIPWVYITDVFHCFAWNFLLGNLVFNFSCQTGVSVLKSTRRVLSCLSFPFCFDSLCRNDSQGLINFPSNPREQWPDCNIFPQSDHYRNENSIKIWKPEEIEAAKSYFLLINRKEISL